MVNEFRISETIESRFMARDAKAAASRFDINGLQQLMELMEKHDVSEVKLQEGEAKYVLRRGPQVVAGAMPAAPIAAAPAPAPAAPSPAPAASGDAAPAADSGLVEIKSPTVGTFYQSPSPDEPPFVSVGDKVSPKTVVCIVEAMKVFNQIPAEVSGTIEQILLKDGDTVEFGQPIFLVRP